MQLVEQACSQRQVASSAEEWGETSCCLSAVFAYHFYISYFQAKSWKLCLAPMLSWSIDSKRSKCWKTFAHIRFEAHRIACESVNRKTNSGLKRERKSRSASIAGNCIDICWLMFLTAKRTTFANVLLLANRAVLQMSIKHQQSIW